MNNNTPAIFKSLIMYAVLVPLAIWMGYLLAAPADRSSFSIWGIMALLMFTPILLRWHHLLLVVCWNLTVMIFFLPGFPMIWLPMAVLSLGISILNRSLNSEARFISAPPITWSLIFLTAVVVFTAEMTGGFGMKAMGSDTVGGKRYVWLLVAIFGYFALTAQRIPPKRVNLYLALFFLSGCIQLIGDFTNILPAFVFSFIPASGYASEGGLETTVRFAGLGVVGMIVFTYMLARYGIRGIFLSGRPLRFVCFMVFCLLVPLGGFRVFTITCIIIFAIQFYLEKMQRTPLLPALALVGVLLTALAVPFANKLPYAFQRSLAFLPLNIDPIARMDAEATQDWRLQMWTAVMPQVPGYLLLGKGYNISSGDYQTMSNESLQNAISASDWGAAISGNFHNGPLSVLIFFGVWGAIAVIWFWIVCIRALYFNFRYGEARLQSVNALLLAFFISKVVIFLIVFGSLYSDMPNFIGAIGLSVSLNGGICRRPALAPKVLKESPARPPVGRPFQPAFQR